MARKRIESYEGVHVKRKMDNLILEYGQVDEKYLKMSDRELKELPMFDENGVVFYEVGDKILGKTAFVKLVETLKIRK